MWIGHPILDEIKQGIKLRPTKTIDKSKPRFLAEGEDPDFIAPTKRGDDKGPAKEQLRDDESDSGLPSSSASTVRSSSPAPSSAPSPLPGDLLGPSGAAPPPPPPPPADGMLPPPPPPPVIKRGTSAAALAALGGKPSGAVDRGALLKGIQSGVRLRKTVTRDASAPIINTDESFAVQQARLAPSPAPEASASSSREATPQAAEFSRPPPPPSTLSPRAGSANNNVSDLSEDDDDDREVRRTTRYAKSAEPGKPVKLDVAYDEATFLKVTADDLQKEIKRGTAAAAAARFMAKASANGDAPPVSYGTLGRRAGGRVQHAFGDGGAGTVEARRASASPTPSATDKKPSKWAPVETGGLRRAGALNTPTMQELDELDEKIEEFGQHERAASPRPPSKATTRRADAAPLSVEVPREADEPPRRGTALSSVAAFVTPPTPNTPPPFSPAAGANTSTRYAWKSRALESSPNAPRSSVPLSASLVKCASQSSLESSPSAKSWYTASENSPVSSVSPPSSTASPSSVSPGDASTATTAPAHTVATTSSSTLPRRPVRGVNPNFEKAKTAFSNSTGDLTKTNGLPAPKPFFLRSTRAESSSPARANGQEKAAEVAALKSALNDAVARKQRLFYDDGASSSIYEPSWRAGTLFNPYTITSGSATISGRPSASRPPLPGRGPASPPLTVREVPIRLIDESFSRDPAAFRRDFAFRIDVNSDTPVSFYRR